MHHILRKIFTAETASAASTTSFLKANQNRHNQMSRFNRRRGSFIRHALKQLADMKWSKTYRFRLIPFRSYRIRQMAGSDHFTWWVEKDIPPFDRFQCAAIIVELTHNAQGRPVMNVISGNHTYPVPDPLESNLTQTLEKAAQDPPAVVPRWMGIAYD